MPEAIERRVTEALHRFRSELHPRDREGEFRGVPGAKVLAAIARAQRLQRIESKLRLRRDNGEAHLAPRITNVQRARQDAEATLTAAGHHLTPMGDVHPVDGVIHAQTPEEKQSFWEVQRADTRNALIAATDPQTREMLQRHLDRLGGEDRDAPLPGERVAGAGAVVNGRAGRWVTALGKMVHVPHNEEWLGRGSEGSVLRSPAGTTDVFRDGVLVSTSGKRATHPDVIRPRRGVTVDPAPEPDPDPEPSPVAGEGGDTSGRRLPPTPDDPPVVPIEDTAPVDPLAARRERAANLAAARHQAEITELPPEPTEAVVPGSLKGTDLTTVHPRSIDTELARMWEGQSRVKARIRFLMSPRSPWRPESERETAERDEERAQEEAHLRDMQAASDPLEAEFERRGGWARYFLVQNGNGHVHSSTECSTCVRPHINSRGRWTNGTDFAWLPDLAAKTEQQMVAEHGESACSVCFPSAPSMYEQMRAAGQLSTTERRTRAEQEARAAERAERQAAKDAKAITNPDGSALRTSDAGVIRTLVTARKELVDLIARVTVTQRIADNGGDTGHTRRLDAYKTDLVNIRAAIAHKLGVSEDEVMAELQPKADRKIRTMNY